MIFKYTAVENYDRGGDNMNLIVKMLGKRKADDETVRYGAAAEDNIKDYGYRLYKSMEYNIKYLKNDDSGLKAGITDTFTR